MFLITSNYMERHLTPSKVAKIFEMSMSRVIKWIREGKIKAIEINGRWKGCSQTVMKFDELL
ncbi:hypothetical protein YN1HA_19200 [Sulfurisphaera ohwakuensis]